MILGHRCRIIFKCLSGYPAKQKGIPATFMSHFSVNFAFRIVLAQYRDCGALSDAEIAYDASA